jgi:hypothetical protein
LTDIFWQCVFATQLHNRLVASVNNASFLAHLEKVRDQPMHEHTALSGGMTGSSLLNIVMFLLNYAFIITLCSLMFCIFEFHIAPFSDPIKPEVDIGDIPNTKGEAKNGSWVLVSCDIAGGNMEEISGIDDENYVMVNEDDIVDAIATFVARCILEDPKSKVFLCSKIDTSSSVLLRHLIVLFFSRNYHRRSCKRVRLSSMFLLLTL